MKTLKDIRIERGFSQEQFASILGIPRRTYQRYERQSEFNCDSNKLRLVLSKAEVTEIVDNEHGVLSCNEILKIVSKVSLKYEEIECVYLFGDYATKTMNEISDVDLFLVANDITDLKIQNFCDELKSLLFKNIKIFTSKNLLNNPNIIDEIFKNGVKLYAKKKGVKRI